jgi:type IV pilus assembly protein PilX
MLLLMTLIGTTGMQSTSLQEKMAGNMRNRNLAFQAAESALEAGESFIGSKTSAELDALVLDPNAFNCTGADGLYKQSGTGCSIVDGPDPDAVPDPIWDTVNWDPSNNPDYATFGGKLAHVNEDVKYSPKYIIEDLGLFDCHGSAAGTNDCRRFRVTARATGGTTDAVVMLQSIYQRPK